METKPCRKCGSTDRGKPNTSSPLGNCKACDKARSKKWHENNSEHSLKLNRAWRKKNVDRHRAISQAWRQAHPDKYAAQNEVHKAVQRGDLPKVSTLSCVDCGIQASQYHHEDYTKPLDVEALCISCHNKRHLINP